MSNADLIRAIDAGYYDDPPDPNYWLDPGWYVILDLVPEAGFGTCSAPFDDCICGDYDWFGPAKSKAGLLSKLRALEREAVEAGCQGRLYIREEPFHLEKGCWYYDD